MGKSFSRSKEILVKSHNENLLALNLPLLWNNPGQLRIRLIQNESKLVIFCCLKKKEESGAKGDNQLTIKPAIITIENFNQYPTSPNVVITEQKIKITSETRNRIVFPNKVWAFSPRSV